MGFVLIRSSSFPSVSLILSHRKRSDLYIQEVGRYYSNDTVSVEFLIEFLREMQEEIEAYSEEDTYKGQIPGQMELSELMDMENDEADGIIESYSLEGSAV